jgi:hypothetical protein
MVNERDPRASAGDALRRGLDEVVETAKQAASEIGGGLGDDLRQTRDQVMDQAETAKRGLAGQVGETAAALNTAAEQFGPQSPQAELFRGAARGLDALSQALKSSSMSGLASDLSEFGRRNPAAFLGGAALAGFALARFAQASAPGMATGTATGTTADGVPESSRETWENSR